MAKYLVETDQGKFEVETEEPDQSHPDFMAPGAEKSLASQAVDAIRPEVSGPPQNEGFLSRLARGTRQTLFPTSMDEVKSLFNPNAGQYGVSRVLEEEGKRVGGAVRGAAGNSAEQLATSKFGQQHPYLAAGAGAAYSTVADAASDSLTPSSFQQQLGAEAIGPVLSEVGSKIKGAAVDPARRALGFQKSQLVSQKSPFETTRKIAQANRSAEAMLEADAISPTGNVPDTIHNATKILSEGSRKMSTVMDAVDNTGKTISASSIDSSQYNAVDKILKDIKAHGKDGLSLKDADELRARWGKIGFSDKTVTSTEADMYRGAFKSIDKQIKRHIESVDPSLAKEYVTAKATQENAINALRGLGNKQAADLGNNLFSLPTKVLAAGQLAAGDVPGALVTAGVAEAVKRRGLAPVAVGTFKVGKALEQGIKPGFLTMLQTAARNQLEAKKGSPGKSPLTKSIRASQPGFERKIKQSLAPTRTASAAPLSADKAAYVQGLNAFLGGDKGTAITAAQRALKLNPKNVEARRLLERLAIQAGKDIDAYK
jgi:hypothetical protein